MAARVANVHACAPPRRHPARWRGGEVQGALFLGDASHDYYSATNRINFAVLPHHSGFLCDERDGVVLIVHPNRAHSPRSFPMPLAFILVQGRVLFLWSQNSYIRRRRFPKIPKTQKLGEPHGLVGFEGCCRGCVRPAGARARAAFRSQGACRADVLPSPHSLSYAHDAHLTPHTTQPHTPQADNKLRVWAGFHPPCALSATPSRCGTPTGAVLTPPPHPSHPLSVTTLTLSHPPTPTPPSSPHTHTRARTRTRRC